MRTYSPRNPRTYCHDWYKHLVNQSQTDHIYGLIHDGLEGTYLYQTKPDFVLIDPNLLNEKIRPYFDKSHLAEESSVVIDGVECYLLHHMKLTPYLELAQEFISVQDEKETEYILLCFESLIWSADYDKNMEFTSVDSRKVYEYLNHSLEDQFETEEELAEYLKIEKALDEPSDKSIYYNEHGNYDSTKMPNLEKIRRERNYFINQALDNYAFLNYLLSEKGNDILIAKILKVEIQIQENFHSKIEYLLQSKLTEDKAFKYLQHSCLLAAGFVYLDQINSAKALEVHFMKNEAFCLKHRESILKYIESYFAIENFEELNRVLKTGNVYLTDELAETIKSKIEK